MIHPTAKVFEEANRKFCTPPTPTLNVTIHSVTDGQQTDRQTDRQTGDIMMPIADHTVQK